MSDFDLDLTQSHFQHQRGDYTVFGTWYGKKRRPALVIIPTFRKKKVPLVIDIDSAWKWNPDDKDMAPEMAAPILMAFLRYNQLDAGNQFTHHKVLSLIHDYIGDLLKMPVKPTSEVVVADAFRTDRETGKTVHEEIIQRV